MSKQSANCPSCGSEKLTRQKVCANCGYDLELIPKCQTPQRGIYATMHGHTFEQPAVEVRKK